MDGELALAIALTAHGSAFLASPGDAPPLELTGTNSTLQYVSAISFQASEAEVKAQSTADTLRRTERGRFEDLRSPYGTSAWFLQLRRAVASGLRTVKLPIKLDLPEVYAAAFSGGIPWAILVDYPKSSGLWIPRWKHEGGAKPWKVHVTGSTITNPPQQASIGLTPAAESLREVLKRALDFSTRAKLEWFPDDFSKALALLDSQAPEIPYHPDLLPSGGYSLLARQVTASATKAYVFGGMGSFNDLGFKHRAFNTEYKALLPSLYNTVVDALLAAANSFGRD